MEFDSITLASTARCGKNVIIGPNTHIGDGVQIGNDSEIKDLAYLSQMVRIGAGVTVNEAIDLAYGVCVEDGVTIKKHVKGRRKVTLDGVHRDILQDPFVYELIDGRCVPSRNPLVLCAFETISVEFIFFLFLLFSPPKQDSYNSEYLYMDYRFAIFTVIYLNFLLQ